jgi:DNA primase
MSVIDEIKDRIDIVELIGETVKLRKSGKNYTGFCPFHPNTRTPAFAVFPDSGTWRCFGACNEGGDAFSFLMKKEGWDFAETFRYLAERTGVELRPRTPEEQAAEEAHERLRELLESAAAFYRHNLLNTEAGEKALSYMHERGFSDETMEIFEIGYAPSSWDATRDHLASRDYSEQDMLEAGVVSQRDSGGVYDRFRHRIMIPIRDARGRLAGFGARALDPEDVPKYLNSPQTVLFDKGSLLYGLDKARKAIRKLDQVVIVEGYMGVIGLHQAGFENVVASMGTALSESQLRQLKRYTRRMTLALDADLAGSQATLRGLTVAREALEREPDPVFDSRGLVRYEGRLDADIRVITLPAGQDPDDVVTDDPAAWPEILERSQTVVEYVMERLLAMRDLDDPKAKGEVARHVLPLIEDVVDPVERETYRQELARRLKVDERALLSWRPGARVRSRRRSGEPEREVGRTLATRQEAPIEQFCLGVLLYDPEMLYRIDRRLQEIGLDRLRLGDFSGTEGQMILRTLREALAQDEQDPTQYWRSDLDESLRDRAELLLQPVEGIDLEQPRVLEEILSNFLRLRKRNLESRLTQLRFQLQMMQEASPDVGEESELGDVWDHTREVQGLASQKERLDRALAGEVIRMHTEASFRGR